MGETGVSRAKEATVERLARAMCEADGAGPDEVLDIVEGRGSTARTVKTPRWRLYEEDARRFCRAGLAAGMQAAMAH